MELKFRNVAFCRDKKIREPGKKTSWQGHTQPILTTETRLTFLLCFDHRMTELSRVPRQDGTAYKVF